MPVAQVAALVIFSVFVTFVIMLVIMAIRGYRGAQTLMADLTAQAQAEAHASAQNMVQVSVGREHGEFLPGVGPSERSEALARGWDAELDARSYDGHFIAASERSRVPSGNNDDAS